MNKNELKEILNYIILDEKMNTNIMEFNDSYSYFSKISQKSNSLTIMLLVFLLCFPLFLIVPIFVTTTISLTITSLMSSLGISMITIGYLMDNEQKIPIIYTLFKSIKEKYIKEQKNKIKNLFNKNPMFYKIMMFRKKRLKNKSLTKYYNNRGIYNKEELIKHILWVFESNKEKEQYVSELSDIVLELNISENKNKSSSYLYKCLRTEISEYENKNNFEKTMIKHSNKNNEEKNSLISSINNNLQKFKTIKKL
jgi:hypothetical protein